MHNDIIAQNVKLIDEKLIINERKLETIDGIKYLVYYVSREFEPTICGKCGSVVYKVKDYRGRIVKTFIDFDYPVLIKYKQRRLTCECGKTQSEHNSIVSKRGRISLKLFEDYTEPWAECKVILRSLYYFFFSINLLNPSI